MCISVLSTAPQWGRVGVEPTLEFNEFPTGVDDPHTPGPMTVWPHSHRGV